MPAATAYRFGQSRLDHPAASIAAPTSAPPASTSATTRRPLRWRGSTVSAWLAVRRRSSSRACHHRLRPLATGLARPWGTRHAQRSLRYTTLAEELMEAEAW